jgi:hypothetical protein
MPLPNGVDPWGHIQKFCPSAEYLGNRGVLHDNDGVITKQWAHKSWIACTLQYVGRSRAPLMRPGRYSELFFLDEATALAAGHRPCGDCRPEDYRRFKAAWFATHESAYMANLIGDIDKVLHEERVARKSDKKTYRALLADLPFGVMFESGGNAYLKWRNGPFLWSENGYESAKVISSEFESFTVLTPPSIVSVFGAGMFRRCMSQPAPD